MAKPTIIILLLAFQLVSSTLFSNITNESEPSKRRLSIKLIHRDSPESPLYRPDLTESQRTQNLILQSKARLEYYFGISNKTLEIGTKGLEAEALKSRVVQAHNSVYMVQVGIGTFRASIMPYFLHIETGYSLTWVQCEGCLSPGHHCFPHRHPLFPDSRSRTYHKLPYGRHSLCFPGEYLQDWCTYHVRYGSSSSRGFLASETFVFPGGNPPRSIPGIVFGCGFDQRNINYGGHADGLIGLGFGRRSMVAQLGDQAHLQFSYCLQRPNSNATTYLRFGFDVPSIHGLNSIDLVQVGQLEFYFVNLIGLSVGTERLVISPSLFARRHNEPRSGTVIDMGTMYSSIVQPAYQILESAVRNHLVHNIPGIARVHFPDTFELCFRRSGLAVGIDGLPSLTFHFDGNVNMVVPPEGVFILQADIICLAVFPTNIHHFAAITTLIGAFQQRNVYFAAAKLKKNLPQWDIVPLWKRLAASTSTVLRGEINLSSGFHNGTVVPLWKNLAAANS